MDEYPLYEIRPNEFPGNLTEIPDPPERLLVRGTLPPPDHILLTVIGSRRYSSYGKQATERIVGGLRGHPITIVSGLALGIDALAHHAALDARLQTVAVPGSGLDEQVLYPRSNVRLAREILGAGGALLSEFEPDFRATQWSFPRRNRIMAGMAKATLVIEASKKSGTLITARLATDYNRDVFAVPNSIFSANSEGPHTLIKLGATPVTSAKDVLDALDLPLVATSPDTKPPISPDEQKILDLLSEPRPRDELIRLMAYSTAEAHARIMALELSGYIRESNGVFIRVDS